MLSDIRKTDGAQTQKPATARKRAERERQAVARDNAKVTRTGMGRMQIEQVVKKERKFAAPTSPRPLPSGRGTWNRETTPVGDLDDKEKKQLDER